MLYPAAGADVADSTRPSYTQPALFALEYALAELWRAWGVRPAVVLGHSIGEYVAACVAGVFSLEDALRLVAARGRLMQALPADGAMVAVPVDEARARQAIAAAGATATVAVAAVNGPGQVVMAGAKTALPAVLAQLPGGATWLPVSHAFHSPLMEPMLAAFGQVAATVQYQRPTLGVVSNVTGALVDEAAIATPAYWQQHVRATVQYARSVETLHAVGCRVVVEVGPRPTLIGLGQQTVSDPGMVWAASLRPGRGEWAQLLETVGTLWTQGVAVDWRGFDQDYARRKVALPTYPFQRQRYWPDLTNVPAAASAPRDAIRTDWLYEFDWTPISGPVLAAPSDIEQAVRPAFLPLAEEHRLERYLDLKPGLDALSAAYVASALADLGCDWRPGTRFTAAQLMSRSAGLPNLGRLVDRMLDILAEEGLVDRDGGEWIVRRAPDAVDVESLRAQLLARNPWAEAEIDLVGRCGPRIADVITGRVRATEVLFPGGSASQLERVYQDAPGSRVFNGLVQKAIAAAVKDLPAGRPIRVLEIGAGTGGTTSSVLPALGASCERYVYTDISQAFLTRAADKFRAYPFLDFRVLDVSNDPASQGFEGERFDLVVAANVLHATPDLRRSMDHVREMVAPGGLLVLIELTAPQRMVDLTFGLTDGWWGFTDTTLRPSHPTLSTRRWEALLGETGFGSAAFVSGADEAIERDMALVVAQRSETVEAAAPQTDAPSKWWLVLADADGAGTTLVEQLALRGQGALLVEKGSRVSRRGGRSRCHRPAPSGRLRPPDRRACSAARRNVWRRDPPVEPGRTADIICRSRRSRRGPGAIDRQRAVPRAGDRVRRPSARSAGTRDPRRPPDC